MKTHTSLLIVAGSLGAAWAAHAQNPALMVSVAAPTTASVYAQTQIELAPGFSTTTGGFEAKLVLPYATAGQWSSPLPWTPYVHPYEPDNPSPLVAGQVGMVGIHTHLLPNGKVLSWEGHNVDRNYQPGVHMESHAYVWDPNPAAPGYPNNYEEVMNDFSDIFCSGHTFLPDGRLLVVGGHEPGHRLPPPVFPPTQPYNQVTDTYEGYPSGVPANTASDYIGLKDFNLFTYNAPAQQPQQPYWQSSGDPGAGALPPMSYRRWYPTATTLSTGEVLVTSGQRYGGLQTQNGQGGISTVDPVYAEIPEVWNPATNSWRLLSGASRRQYLYPWLFQAPNGRVFEAGPGQQSYYLNPSGAGTWTAGPTHRSAFFREYGAAVMYEPGKILIAGGGNQNDNITNSTELIDLNAANPQFVVGAAMVYVRRHVNGTLLPDGTVLATGGTTSNGSDDRDAVLPTELWTPPTSANPGGSWTTLAALSVPRCYHSTALLLPDGRVLTTGQGQGAGFANHPDYQVFSPPYLFRGPRPQLTQAPTQVVYGQSFWVQTPDAGSIAAVNWVRLSSVTHSFNMNQRLNHLAFAPISGGLNLTAPASPTDCPPGQYMLFLLNTDGVPSLARVITIGPQACSTTLRITYQATVEGDCTGQAQITASTSNLVTSYRWSVDGTYAPAFDGQNTITLGFDANNTPSRYVEVAVTPACGGQPLVNGQTIALYFPGCANY